MAKDVELMTKNAKTYNEPGSQVFKVKVLFSVFFFMSFNTLNINNCSFILQDANTIKKVFIQRKTELEHAEPTKSSLRIRY